MGTTNISDNSFAHENNEVQSGMLDPGGFHHGYSRIGDHRRRKDYRWIAVALAIIGVIVSGILIAVLAIKGSNDQTLIQPQLVSSIKLADNEDFQLLQRPPHIDADNAAARNPENAFPNIPGSAFQILYRKEMDEENEAAKSEKSYHGDDTCNRTTAASLFHYHNAQYPQVDGNLKSSRAQEKATKSIAKQYNIRKDQFLNGIDLIEIGPDKDACSKTMDKDKKRRPTIVCGKDQKYRTFDGTCNNLKRVFWGAADTPFRRGLLPDYADGISEPRESAVSGLSLPNARLLSAGFHSSKKVVEDERHTSLTTFWGQFVAHDITKVKPNLDVRNCCLRNYSDSRKAKSDQECFRIDISDTDEFYSEFNVTCLDFVRSMPAERNDCRMGPREQINQVTSFLDGSVIYGSSDVENNALRSLQNGQLKMESIAGEEMLPTLNRSTPYCTHKTTDSFCFLAGEGRCNENLVLASLHTLFARQHNRLAVQLQELNANWNDERLFQEARRIVIAQLQHITYTEYLPRLFGAGIMARFSVKLKSKAGKELEPAGNRYETMVNPSISNEFATAAFRFGHATVPGLTQLMSANDMQLFQLHRGLFSPSLLVRSNDSFARLLNGAAAQQALRVDPYVSRQLTRHLFESAGVPGSGLDLVAINIQRGRDHGIPGYNAFRKYCSLPAINSSDGYLMVFDTVAARTFVDLYETVDDLDLFVGGLAEPSRVPDGMLGPVFACLVAEQFARLRQGDRFWYENDATDGHPHPFNEHQLSEIRSTTLARIICDNVPAVRNIKPDVFHISIKDNLPIACSGNAIRSPDINYWEENDGVDELFADLITNDAT